MEKKTAFRPPSFMRGISMLPVLVRSPTSNLPSRKRCVVSSWVSTTIEAKCSLRAFSETETAERVKAATSKREMDAQAKSWARVICSPKLCAKPDCKRKWSATDGKVGVMLRYSTGADQKLASKPAE